MPCKDKALKPNRTYCLLVLPNEPATFTAPDTRGPVTLDILNLCPNEVFAAGGDKAIAPGLSEFGGYAINTGERVELTVPTNKVSFAVRSLGGLVYITQV